MTKQAQQLRFEKGRRVFLGPDNWDVTLEAVYNYVEKLPKTSNKYLVALQTWRLLAEANNLKRFILEVENHG
jgi:hypothetical protein